jgi:hypothetical protein
MNDLHYIPSRQTGILTAIYGGLKILVPIYSGLVVTNRLETACVCTKK